jgi:hypothetical protein
MTASFEPRAGLSAVNVPINEETLMRKSISAFLAGVMLFGFTIVLTGCTEESGVKTDAKITAPDGSSTTEHREIKVNKSGENAPLAPSEKK